MRLSRRLFFSIAVAFMITFSNVSELRADLIDLPSPDDVCGYGDITECMWSPGMPHVPGVPDVPASCVVARIKEVYCEHKIPCGKPHTRKTCNPNATGPEDCVLVDQPIKCQRLPKPPETSRLCRCLCKTVEGEILDIDSVFHFRQPKPYTQTCQEEFDQGNPVMPGGSQLLECEGYIYDEEDPDSPPSFEYGYFQCGVVDED